jgi:hypothetical protein
MCRSCKTLETITSTSVGTYQRGTNIIAAHFLWHATFIQELSSRWSAVLSARCGAQMLVRRVTVVTGYKNMDRRHTRVAEGDDGLHAGNSAVNILKR